MGKELLSHQMTLKPSSSVYQTTTRWRGYQSMMIMFKKACIEMITAIYTDRPSIKDL